MTTILVVCTGNVCRSPLAEQLLQWGLGDAVAVSSAGTDAPVGASMDTHVQSIARRYGLNAPERHRARALTLPLLRETNLVLVATRQHRSSVAKMLPRISRNTYTIREFARILNSGLHSDDDVAPRQPIADIAELIALAAKRRGYSPVPEDPTIDDIIDPYRRDHSVYQQMEIELVPAVEAVIRATGREVPWRALLSGADGLIG